jgi:hypothetical protein
VGFDGMFPDEITASISRGDLSVERRCSGSAVTSAFMVEAARFSEMLGRLPIAICCKETKHKVNIDGKL